MTEEMLEKAKAAQSPEELLTLMRENGSEEFTMENAEALYAQMHTSGEQLTDEEMEAVTGGRSTTVGGQKHLVVTCSIDCRTGQYAVGVYRDNKTNDIISNRADHGYIRYLWYCFSGDNQCGTCIHLGFTKSGTGYCEVSNG